MIVIALGGNLPFGRMAPEQTQEAALAALAEQGDIRVIRRSRFWSSPAWPDPSSPRYVNAAAALETTLSPEALLARLHDIEAHFGRERSEADRWAARTLDLDLIDHDGAVRTGPGLVLPHPRAHQRAFVLLPLADIAPDWEAPDGHGIGELISRLPEADRAATTVLQTHTVP